MKYENITAIVLKSFYKVYNTHGYGFLEKVYQNSLMIELIGQNLLVQKQRQINVFYLGQQVGEYYADLVINDVVIIELKAHECIIEEHENQLINYLKATEIEVGLLLNFGPKPEFKETYLRTKESECCRQPLKKFRFNPLDLRYPRSN